MIWFFAFTSLGMVFMLFLLLIQNAVKPGWKDALAAITGFGLMALFLRD